MSSAYILSGLAFSWGSYKGGTAMAQVILLATYAWVQYQIEVYKGKPHLIGSDNKLELNGHTIADIVISLLVLVILVALIIFTSAKINIFQPILVGLAILMPCILKCDSFRKGLENEVDEDDIE